MKKSFYITTTLPYVNAEPHVGFAMEIIRADIIARVKKLEDYDVFFNTGTDEHGAKVHRNAMSLGLEPKKYVDDLVLKFKELLPLLGISSDINFVRTTDEHHTRSAGTFWKVCKDRGFIYKKNYKIKYCVGCELEKTESELVDGKCPLHPLMNIEEIEEENYFFKFSEFQKPLLDFYSKNPDFVIPSFRFNEIKAFVERGLQDFSISRLKSKMPWGIEVPDDKDHVMYVWFDALVNYISAIGWPDDMEKFEKYWTNIENKKHGIAIQYCGKDNLRQQSAMWQAMLMSVGLPNSRQIVIDGFVTGEGGVKMSKSLGNVINPVDVVKEYGTDALRYYLLREVSPFEDSPFTMERFKESYNAHLANGLGNLVSRVMRMVESNNIKFDVNDANTFSKTLEMNELYEKQIKFIKDYNLKEAMDTVWELIAKTDSIIQKEEPFKKVKTDLPLAQKIIKELLNRVYFISTMLIPFLPETAKMIEDCVLNNKMPEKPLFMRK